MKYSTKDPICFEDLQTSRSTASLHLYFTSTSFVTLHVVPIEMLPILNAKLAKLPVRAPI